MPRLEGVECCFCHDQLLGKTSTEAAMDALNVGWEQRNGQWVCADCIIEEGKL